MSSRHRPYTQEFVCLNCQNRGKPEYVSEGSPLVAMALTLLFVVPGLLYICWQFFNRFPVCAVCGSQKLRRARPGMDDPHRSRSRHRARYPSGTDS